MKDSSLNLYEILVSSKKGINNMETLKERLVQALDDFGVGNELYDDHNDKLADYLMEVIDELHTSDNSIDYDQKAEPRNPQVGEIWASTK